MHASDILGRHAYIHRSMDGSDLPKQIQFFCYLVEARFELFDNRIMTVVISPRESLPKNKTAGDILLQHQLASSNYDSIFQSLPQYWGILLPCIHGKYM